MEIKPSDFEYIIPKLEEGSLNLKCHYKRYEFALSYCKEKKVLDIACGAGYGTAILSRVAKKVIGVDKNEESIRYAEDNYKSENNKFVISDAIKYLEENENYDIVICLETLEHLDDKKFISLIKKPLIFSVPYNEKVLTKWHKRSYREEDLKNLFKGREIEFWYQHPDGEIDKNNENVQNLIGVIMTKLIIYVKGGIGDIYPVISWLPEIIKKYDVKKEDVKLFVDSVYLIDWPISHREIFEAEAKEIIHREFDNFEIIPRGYTSAYDTNFPTPRDRRIPPEIWGIKNDFMFWRNTSTKEYMKGNLNKGDIFIDFMHTEQAYVWNDGEYREKLNCKRMPLHFEPDEKEKEVIDELCNKKHILIHVREKGKETGKGEPLDFFDKIIKHSNMKCILIGLPTGCIEGDIMDLRGLLSFRGNMYLIEKAKYMIVGSSGFAYHRLYQNFKDKKTIFNWPRDLGDDRYFLCKEHLENPNHIFFDANEDHLKDIIKEIEKWK